MARKDGFMIFLQMLMELIKLTNQMIILRYDTRTIAKDKFIF